jgi:hypothetical protein
MEIQGTHVQTFEIFYKCTNTRNIVNFIEWDEQNLIKIISGYIHIRNMHGELYFISRKPEQKYKTDTLKVIVKYLPTYIGSYLLKTCSFSHFHLNSV